MRLTILYKLCKFNDLFISFNHYLSEYLGVLLGLVD